MFYSFLNSNKVILRQYDLLKHVKVEDYSSINSNIGLHDVLAKLNSEGGASEVLLPSQAYFVMCLVERGFISKASS